MQIGKVAERCQFNDRFYTVFEKHRKHDHALWNRLEQAGTDGRCIVREIGDQHAPFVGSALSNQTFSNSQTAHVTIVSITGKCGEHHHSRRLFGLHLVNHALLRVHQRREFGEKHSSYSGQIALPLQHTGEPGQVGLEPILLSIAICGQTQVVDHGVDVVFEFRDFAGGFDLNGSRQVAFGHGGGHFSNRAHLAGEVVSEQVDVTGEVFPRSGSARHAGLPSEPAIDAHFTGHCRYLIGEGGKCIGHVIDGFSESGDFTFRFHREVLGQFAVGDGGHDLHDTAHLFCKVRGHNIDVVGEVFPGSRDSGHLRLASEFSVSAHFAGHAGNFCGEGVELVDHRVDGVFQLKNFALHVYRDFARQVAARHSSRDFCDVTHLAGEVSGHGVHGVRKIFPRSGDTRHIGLSAETTFSSHFTGHTGHFSCE